MNILELNQDCLLYLFSFVGLYDLVNLSEVHEYFFEVCQEIFKRQKEFKLKFRNVDIRKTIKILEYIGPCLEKLHMTVGYTIPNQMILDVLIALVDFSKKLNYLTIHYLKTNKDHIYHLKKIMPSLKYLDLSYCDLEDTAEELLVQCKELDHLVLIGNYRYLGKGLESMKTLKKLAVEFKTVFDNSIYAQLKHTNPGLQIEVYENGKMVRSVMEAP